MAKARIQVVEDEGITSSYIMRTLENMGYSITSIEISGEGAIRKAAEDKPDLVLMDIQLRGKMDGIEAAAVIRGQFDIPVVYLTSHSDEGTLSRAKITEPFGYVLKPLQSRELVSNIEMALYKHGVEQKLKEMAHFDMLTGLPNRTLFFDRLDQALRQGKRTQKTIALLVLDLDGFKYINDRFGHDAGDLVLKEIALRLKHCVRDTDTVARLGGDEFVIIFTNLKKPIDARTLATKIIVSVGKPLRFDASLNLPYCSLGVSIGVCFYPIDGEDAPTLLKKADIAMYRAKERGKNNCQFFTISPGADDPCMDSDHIEAAENLRIALNLAAGFVLTHSDGWNHDDWVDFLNEVMHWGITISNTVETQLGLVLESLKQFCMATYPSVEPGQPETMSTNPPAKPPDIFVSAEESCLPPFASESTLSGLCNEIANLLIGSNGIWTQNGWEAFLDKVKALGINVATDEALNETPGVGGETEQLIGNVMEAAKSLFIYLR